MACTKHKHSSSWTAWECEMAENRRKARRLDALAVGKLPVSTKIIDTIEMNHYPWGKEINLKGVSVLVFSESKKFPYKDIT